MVEVTERARAIREEDQYVVQPCRGTFGGNAQGRRYGFFDFADYFTDRQLVALTTFGDLVAEARQRVREDATSAGKNPNAGGAAAGAYADAIATYLAMVISKIADRGSSLVTWVVERESTRNTFARQAISMSWDFVEANQLTRGTGSWDGALTWTVESIASTYPSGKVASIEQADAATRPLEGYLISTDPPYYDNVGYSDLSDFFYVWLRRSLRSVYPGLLSTVLVPKADELVVNPYRHGGTEVAKQFFESGFRDVFAHARDCALDGFPVTVYYAFKQSESDTGETFSTGWETLLEGMVGSGWEITATWPLRSERGGRMIGIDANALASSIVLALRPRALTATTTDRRGFIEALRSDMPIALRNLQQGQVAPVDLPQAAIGPGMAVFSRYSKVLEDDGSRMTVRSALARINEILDQVLNEQEGDFDGATRFAVAWYRQHGYGTGKFGDADNLARARNTAVDALGRDGVLTSGGGKVALIKPESLSETYDISTDKHVGTWEALQHLIRVLDSGGVGAAGELLAKAVRRVNGPVDGDLVKELAFLLFRIAEDCGWTKDALAFNALATSWADIVDASRGQRCRWVCPGRRRRPEFDSAGAGVAHVAAAVRASDDPDR